MYFTISFKEPTAIEMADAPTGLDVTSCYRHLCSLREFVQTLRPENSIRILIAMEKQCMNEFLAKILHKTAVMTVIIAEPEKTICENALISELIKQEPTVLVTDLAKFEKELKKVINDSLVKGIVLLDGEPEIKFYDDGKAFRSLRKPVKPGLLVKTLHEMLLSVLSYFEPDHKLAISDASILPPTQRSKWLGEYTKVTIPSSTAETGSQKQEPGDEIIARPAELLTSSFAKIYPLRLMLAEDNLLNQQLMTRILAKYGYTDLYVVDNGMQAYEVFRRLSTEDTTRINAIFMDMQMPEVEGPEATYLIRSYCNQSGCPQPHIMALTAKAFSEDRAECMRAGMCTYLSKPIRWTTLEEELIKAHEAVNNRSRCSCNEERLDQISISIQETSQSSLLKQHNLPVAKSTGLDV